MDPKQLYEQQIAKGPTGPSPESLGGRERALLHWISQQERAALSQPGARVAELSIGDGQLSRALARECPSTRIDCIDISPSRLEQARHLAGQASPPLIDQLRFLEMNLDTEFDRLERQAYRVVIAIDVLEHVFDPFAFVRQCHEILKAGGGLYLRVPNLVYFKRRLDMLSGKLPVTSSWFESPGSYQSWKDRHGWDGGHLHFFTIDSLRWLLQTEGFEVLSWNDVGAKAANARRFWPGMLFGNLAVAARKGDSPHASAS